MKRLAFLLSLILIAVVAGIALTVRLDWTTPLKAVEFFDSSVHTAVQPVAILGGGDSLPNFAQLTKKVGPAVVNISTTKVPRRPAPSAPRRGPRMGPEDPFEDFFERYFGGGPMERPQRSLGSGFIINREGYILT